MLLKQNRIPRSLFGLFKGKTINLSNDLFFVKVVKGDGLSRFCFSVSKKIAKKAVIRNKMRRLGYTELNERLERLKSGFLAIFYFRKIPESRNEIGKSLDLLLKKTNLIK